MNDKTLGRVGLTHETNEKNDDYCVYQFNRNNNREATLKKPTQLRPNTDLAMLPPSIIEIEDEINEINNKILEEQ